MLFGSKLFVVFYNTVSCQQKQIVLWKNNKSIKCPVLSIKYPVLSIKYRIKYPVKNDEVFYQNI